MNRKILWISGVLLSGGLTLSACGPSESEQAELAICEQIARAALNNPETFKVTESKVEETSEGVEILIEADYSGAAGAGHVSDKCWFPGYSDEKPLKRFSTRSDPSGDYVELPDAELQALLKQLQG